MCAVYRLYLTRAMATPAVSSSPEEATKVAAARLSMESLFFSNLILLGFDPTAYSKKYGISFAPDMFKKSNTKGMEVVLYYLLLRLDPERTKETFKAVWPPAERTQQRDFKKFLFETMERLEKEGHLPSNTVRLSHLQTCSGERFVNMVWQLSSLALRSVLKREHPTFALPSLVTTSLDASALKSKAALIIESLRRDIEATTVALADRSRHAIALREVWQVLNNSLDDELQVLNSQLEELKTARSTTLELSKSSSAGTLWNEVSCHTKCMQAALSGQNPVPAQLDDIQLHITRQKELLEPLVSLGDSLDAGTEKVRLSITAAEAAIAAKLATVPQKDQASPSQSDGPASPQMVPPTPTQNLLAMSPAAQFAQSPRTPMFPQPKDAELLRAALHNQANGRVRSLVHTAPSSGIVGTPPARPAPPSPVTSSVTLTESPTWLGATSDNKENTQSPLTTKSTASSLEVLATRLARIASQTNETSADAAVRLLPTISVPDLMQLEKEHVDKQVENQLPADSSVIENVSDDAAFVDEDSEVEFATKNEARVFTLEQVDPAWPDAAEANRTALLADDLDLQQELQLPVESLDTALAPASPAPSFTLDMSLFSPGGHSPASPLLASKDFVLSEI